MRMELLAPATSVEGIYGAIQAGADAIYFGGTKFSARAFADNLNIEQMRDVFDYGHLFGVSFYITINTLLKNREIEKELYEYFEPIYLAGVDGVLVQDLGVLRFIRTHFPDVAVHISTQMNLLTASGAKLAKRLGASRIVLARETSLADMHSIHRDCDIELEVFAHGALCYCYSGQCLFSSMIGGRSGNRGRCAQACRLPYTVEDKQQYYLSPRDLCTLELIPQLARAGVSSLKIEGRMKRNEYTAMVVSMYRKYLDLYDSLCEDDRRNGTDEADRRFRVEPQDLQLLEELYSRGHFTDGYLQRHNGPEMLNLDKPGYNNKNEALLEQIRADYLMTPKRFALRATAELRIGQPIRLAAQVGERQVEVTGVTAEAARAQAMTAEVIAKHIQKTGGTAFVFEELKVEADEGVFVAVAALKQLRRDFLAAVKEVVAPTVKRSVLPYRQERAETVADGREKKVSSAETVTLQVRIEKEEMLEAVLAQSAVSAVIIDILLPKQPQPAFYERLNSRIHAVGKQSVYALPRISREADLAAEARFLSATVGFDAVLLRSVDQLGWLEEIGYKGQIYSDHSVSMMNERSVAFLLERQVLPTVSLELNQKELKHMPLSTCAVQVYGLTPMMVTAGCIRKTRSGCSGRIEELEMTDRLGTVFPVKTHCRYCYNIIYNSLPLVLLEETIRERKPAVVRVDFVNESEAKIREVLQAAADYYVQGESAQISGEFTRGHYKRGVD
ncbi:MAG: U32 family peptidase [Eubacteriales bacterium]|nr:U32 family peptidase [Eubacteriales bacterium]